MYNRRLCQAILSIWSWSLLQFTLVLTATKGRRDQSGVVEEKHYPDEPEPCCNPDVYGIIISIAMQDIPFLILRMLLIFKYSVLSYSNMFFTCKNSLVIALLLYRLVMVQFEKRQELKKKNIILMSESASGFRLITNSTSAPSLYSIGSTRKTYPREKQSAEADIAVNFVMRRHVSFDDSGRDKSKLMPMTSPINEGNMLTGNVITPFGIVMNDRTSVV